MVGLPDLHRAAPASNTINNKDPCHRHLATLGTSMLHFAELAEFDVAA